jgi:hypothetical protein
MVLEVSPGRRCDRRVARQMVVPMDHDAARTGHGHLSLGPARRTLADWIRLHTVKRLGEAR